MLRIRVLDLVVDVSVSPSLEAVTMAVPFGYVYAALLVPPWTELLPPDYASSCRLQAQTTCKHVLEAMIVLQ